MLQRPVIQSFHSIMVKFCMTSVMLKLLYKNQRLKNYFLIISIKLLIIIWQESMNVMLNLWE